MCSQMAFQPLMEQMRRDVHFFGLVLGGPVDWAVPKGRYRAKQLKQPHPYVHLVVLFAYWAVLDLSSFRLFDEIVSNAQEILTRVGVDEKEPPAWLIDSSTDEKRPTEVDISEILGNQPRRDYRPTFCTSHWFIVEALLRARHALRSTEEAR